MLDNTCATAQRDGLCPQIGHSTKTPVMKGLALKFPSTDYRNKVSSKPQAKLIDAQITNQLLCLEDSSSKDRAQLRTNMARWRQSKSQRDQQEKPGM